MPRGGIENLAPQVGNIHIISTTNTSVTLEARVNITNPTPYTAFIPSISVHVLSNGSIVGEARATILDIKTGNNTDLLVSAEWNPSIGGDSAVQIGRDLLSQYISGYNTSVMLRAHRNSIPSQPLIGHALSKVNITAKLPRLRLPGNDDDDSGGRDKGRFIRDSTFHIFSSTATFTLVSPLAQNTLYIEHVNATAFYNHTEPVGQIVYDDSLPVPPGASETPKLPVEWSWDSVGLDKLREAMGGTLLLDARAVVGVRIGNWKEVVWYVGRGIGAHVRP